VAARLVTGRHFVVHAPLVDASNPVRAPRSRRVLIAVLKGLDNVGICVADLARAALTNYSISPRPSKMMGATRWSRRDAKLFLF